MMAHTIMEKSMRSVYCGVWWRISDINFSGSGPSRHSSGRLRAKCSRTWNETLGVTSARVLVPPIVWHWFLLSPRRCATRKSGRAHFHASPALFYETQARGLCCEALLNVSLYPSCCKAASNHSSLCGYEPVYQGPGRIDSISYGIFGDPHLGSRKQFFIGRVNQPFFAGFRVPPVYVLRQSISAECWS
jgi:hypothetical protein